MGGLMWFRRDLRLGDNPAWAAATRDHDELIALYIIDPRLWDRASQRRRNLLGSHLTALDAMLQTDGGRLRIEIGNPVEILGELAQGRRVHWNNDATPFSMARDAQVEAAVGRVTRYEGSHIHGPGRVVKPDGSAYRVFTAYWRAWNRTMWRMPLAAHSVNVVDHGGTPLPVFDFVAGAGEVGAQGRLDEFMQRVDDYEVLRDDPAADGTSRLSTDLKFGTISPHRIVAEVGDATPGRRALLRQLAWRDFYASVMADRPDTVDKPYRPEYASIPWNDDPIGLEAWKVGRTGFPLVDAGMRQLAEEGFMHNRVRMIAASFLVKDLLIDWRLGERWFRHHLVDGDVAQNVGNWQWVAGTGVDASPYFRVFNPTTQSKRFDPDGSYIRRWVPELRAMPDSAIHEPWAAARTDSVIAEHLNRWGYPMPLVDHGEARTRTIEVYAAARAQR